MRAIRIVKDLEVIAGSIAAAQSCFLAMRMVLDRNRYRPNLFLGFFFFAIGLCIIKSLLWVSLPGLPDWVLNLGFAAHSATGPLLLLYLAQYAYGKKWSPYWLWHFVPTLFLLLNLNSFSLDGFWYLGGYTTLLLHQMGYTIVSITLLLYVVVFNKKRKVRLQKEEVIWLVILFLGMALIQTAYFSNYLIGATPYLLGPAMYAIFVYATAFYLAGCPRVMRASSKGAGYGNIRMDPSTRLRYKQQLEQLIHEQEPYLEHDCTIGEIASSLGLPVYLLSYLINSEYGQNFPEFINSFRIEKAKELLASNESRKLKIASIAYDCGFHSLSSFNTFFRKYTGLTPSAYRKRMPDL